MENDFHFFLKRGLFYLTIYFLTILTCVIIYIFFNFQNLPMIEENERSLISSIIQSQATILAIVFSLIIVAIQMTASQYSTRLINYYKKDPDFWILITIYIISMIYGMMILKELNTSFSFFKIPFKFLVFLELWTGIYTFIILIPFFWNTISFIVPGTLIKKISHDIKFEKLFDTNSNFILLFKITESALQKNDNETCRSCLNEIFSVMKSTFKNSSEDQLKIIIGNYWKQMYQLANVAWSVGNDHALSEICETHTLLIGELLKGKKFDCAKESIFLLIGLSIEANKNKMYTSNLFTIGEIHSLAEICLKEHNDVIFSILVDGLKENCETSINEGNFSNIPPVLILFKKLSDIIIENNDERNFDQSTKLLTELTRHAISKNIGSDIGYFIDCFHYLQNQMIKSGRKYDKSGHDLQFCYEEINSYLITSSYTILFFNNTNNVKNLMKFSILNNMKESILTGINAVNRVVSSGLYTSSNPLRFDGAVTLLSLEHLKEISVFCIDQKNQELSKNFILLYTKIFQNLTDNDRRPFYNHIINDCKEILEKTIESIFDDVSSILVYCLGYLGNHVIKKEEIDLTFIVPKNILKEMGIDALTDNSQEELSPILKIIEILGESGYKASIKKMDTTTQRSTVSLCVLLMKCAEKKYWTGQTEICKALIKIGQSSFTGGLEDASKWVIDHVSFSLKNLKHGASIEDVENQKFLTETIIKLFYLMGLLSIKSKKIPFTNDIIDHIFDIPKNEEFDTTKFIERIVKEMQEVCKEEPHQKFLDLYHERLKLRNSKTNL
jgi:hypothetical protein